MGASSKREYVLKRWLIYVNISLLSAAKSGLIDIGSFNIMLRPCSLSDIPLVWEKQLPNAIHNYIQRMQSEMTE